MLTVKQINEISFGRASFSGYKPEDVDKFIDEVIDSFRQLESERDDAVKKAKELSSQSADLSAKNAELEGKVSLLAKEVETYRTEEDGIKDVMFSAQKMARDTVQEAKDKAELILLDAQDNAKKVLDDAKVDAVAAAEEYMAQAQAKKDELEEIKRQVTAFRSSLLEMYKKHLECIDHIPSFRQKEKAEEPEKPAEAGETAVSQPEAPVQPEMKPEEPAAASVEPAAIENKAEPEPEQKAEPVSRPQPQRESALYERISRESGQQDRVQPSQFRQQPSLHDRLDFTREPVRADREFPHEDDLSDVGIDIKSYSDIPESLRREKSSRYNNLEFGDGVDLDQRRKRK